MDNTVLKDLWIGQGSVDKDSESPWEPVLSQFVSESSIEAQWLILRAWSGLFLKDVDR